MKKQFTLRDSMWLIVVVALALGLGAEHVWRVQSDRENADLAKELEAWRQKCAMAMNESAQLKLIANQRGLAPLDFGALEIAKPGELHPTAVFVPVIDKQ